MAKPSKSGGKRPAQDGCAPRWNRRPESRRPEIIEAAIAVFGELGFRRATLQDVAKRAGVSAATISHYFGSKADLFEAAVTDRFGGFVTNEEAVFAMHQQAPVKMLEQLLRRLWDHSWTCGTLPLIQILHLEREAFPQSGRLVFQRIADRWRRLIKIVLELGMASGDFRKVDLDVAARTISYALLGVARNVATFSEFDPSMPNAEVMWRHIHGMIERFVQNDDRSAVVRRSARKSPAGGFQRRSRS